MWRKSHYNMIIAFVRYLNQWNQFVLKGGTSLMLCYGLDRFSGDIDLDPLDARYDIIPIVDSFCNQSGTQYRVVKNINTVKHCMIHYGGAKPLKVEVSYRRALLPESLYCRVDNILVYTIQTLLDLKLRAYMGRDRLRDLYDVTYIARNYISVISEYQKEQVMGVLSQRGLEYFDYLISTQSDPLINNDKLASDFLELYNYLGLL